MEKCQYQNPLEPCPPSDAHAPKTFYDKKVEENNKKIFTNKHLTLWEPVYDIFVLRFRPKKQQFSVALPTP